MMTVKIYYDFKDLPAEIDRGSLSDNGCGKENATYLVVKRDGKIVRIESSAMEPEDVSFVRDLSWVAEAIRQAYQFGLEDGKPALPLPPVAGRESP